MRCSGLIIPGTIIIHAPFFYQFPIFDGPSYLLTGRGSVLNLNGSQSTARTFSLGATAATRLLSLFHPS